MTLFWKVFTTNVALLTLAALALAFTPATVSSPVLVTEAAVLGLGVALIVVADWLILRRTFAPFEHLKQFMTHVDPLVPGQRVEIHGGQREFEDLAQAVNEMMGRLEAERRESARRASAAEEGERRRVARELHDEVGQRLGALLLEVQGLARQLPDEFGGRVEEIREQLRTALEEIREIARRLRPEALDELGLGSALAALTTSFGRGGLHVERRIDRPLPALNPDEELAVYRVAQEALANVARHADVTTASLRLRATDDAVELLVADRGSGFAGNGVAGGQGLRGMRERALMVGGRLDVRAAPGHGTLIRLVLPRRRPA